MFQPDEETFQESKNMIENGILKDHPVDGFKINIQGKGSHGGYTAHNPKVQFNEDVCPIGASCMAHCATEWLKNNK